MKQKSGIARGIGKAGGIQTGGTGFRPVATPEPGGGGIQGAPVSTPIHPVATPQPISHEPESGIHPLMVASLPQMASGADMYARQFYRGSRVPYRRYLPVSLK